MSGKFQIWGLVSWKFQNLGACELKISKFGGLRAKIWVKIEAVEAKISKLSQKGVLWTDSFAWNGTLASGRRGVKRGSSGPHIRGGGFYVCLSSLLDCSWWRWQTHLMNHGYFDFGKPKDPQFEPHGGIKVEEALESPFYICGDISTVSGIWSTGKIWRLWQNKTQGWLSDGTKCYHRGLGVEFSCMSWLSDGGKRLPQW